MRIFPRGGRPFPMSRQTQHHEDKRREHPARQEDRHGATASAKAQGNRCSPGCLSGAGREVLHRHCEKQGGDVSLGTMRLDPIAPINAGIDIRCQRAQIAQNRGRPLSYSVFVLHGASLRIAHTDDHGTSIAIAAEWDRGIFTTQGRFENLTGPSFAE